MAEWRGRGFWGKAWIVALLGLLAVTFDGADLSCLGGGSDRKRVFSPGFIALCVFVVVVELIVLNHWYKAQG
ncbi:hypothetical protein EC849_102186 [Pseudomonas putida]|uniref:hypothetical protein n=1 Tax=Pseudomonas putida TaxID=303 RepID=UPI0010499B33|nr:hypothetical protein [Pseudomonas putida]TCP78351.1 hypothetical protein EC849_102186 [Pseudomonas putida]